jgi:hypothetical protein
MIQTWPFYGPLSKAENTKSKAEIWKVEINPGRLSAQFRYWVLAFKHFSILASE